MIPRNHHGYAQTLWYDFDSKEKFSCNNGILFCVAIERSISASASIDK